MSLYPTAAEPLGLNGRDLTLELDLPRRRLAFCTPTGPLTVGQGLELELFRGAGQPPVRFADGSPWQVTRRPGGIEVSSTLEAFHARVQLVAVHLLESDGFLLHLCLEVLEPLRLEGCQVTLDLAPGAWCHSAQSSRGPLRRPTVLPAPTGTLLLERGDGAASLALCPVDHQYWTTRLEPAPDRLRVALQRRQPSVGEGPNLPPGRYYLLSLHLTPRPEEEDMAAPADMLATGRTRSARPAPDNDFVVVLCPPWQTIMAPLWPAMLNATARQAGLRGTCVDANTMVARRLAPEHLVLWEMHRIFRWCKARPFEAIWAVIKPHMQEVARRIEGLDPAVVGLCTTDANMRCSLRLAGLVKEVLPWTRIVVGGPGVFWTTETPGGRHPLAVYDQWEHKFIDGSEAVDVYLRGEADMSFPDLVHRLKRGEDPLQVPGAVALRDGRWVGPHPPVRPDDLDRLPFPDYDGLHFPSYRSICAPVLSSRGCPHRCAFCCDCVLQGSYRWRSGDHVFAEVERLHARFQLQAVNFTDLLINGRPRQLERFCDRVIASEMQIAWSGQATASDGLTPALLEKMARAGCFELTFGVESLSAEVLQAMRKPRVGQTLALLRAARQVGITTAINILVGCPGETPEMFEQTLRRLERHRDAISRIQAINECTLAYGSALWEEPATFDLRCDVADPCRGWFTTGGNVPAVRQQRLAAAVAAARRLGLFPAEVNVYDDGEHALPAGVKPMSQFVEL